MKKKLSRQILRHNARRSAVQALYQWHYAQNPLSEMMADFRNENDLSEVDDEYFQLLVSGVVNEEAAIAETISKVINRPLLEINPVELAVLRISTYELMSRLDIPYRVVINEALNVNKEFGSEQGYKYVNGVLDALAPQLRAIEFAAKK